MRVLLQQCQQTFGFGIVVENTLTLKQTITAGDGTVTTQTRNINDHDPNRVNEWWSME